MICKDAAAAQYETPPGLIIAAHSHWVAAQGSSAMLPPSDTARDVSRVLAAMGVPHVQGLPGEDKLFTLRLALPERWAGGCAGAGTAC